MSPEHLDRIVVIGTSCSGKTTLASKVAVALDVPHIELNAIHWLPQWEMRATEEFRVLTQEAIASERWTLDGNYGKVRDIVWGRATTLIWLNYPFFIVWFRALARTTRRVFDQQELFSGNRETFRQAFLSKDSILWWVLMTYSRRRRDYPKLFQQPEYAHLHVIEFSYPTQAKQFLGTLEKERVLKKEIH